MAVIMLAIIGTVFIFSASNYSALNTYGDSLYFASFNRNKKSVAIDFRSEKGKEIFEDIKEEVKTQKAKKQED